MKIKFTKHFKREKITLDGRYFFFKSLSDVWIYLFSLCTNGWNLKLEGLFEGLDFESRSDIKLFNLAKPHFPYL